MKINLPAKLPCKDCISYTQHDGIMIFIAYLNYQNIFIPVWYFVVMSLTKINTRLNVATKFIFGSEILPSACETKSNFIQGQTALYSVSRYRIIKHNQYIDTNRITNYYIDELLRQNFQKSIPSLSHYVHLELDIIISFYLFRDIFLSQCCS